MEGLRWSYKAGARSGSLLEARGLETARCPWKGVGILCAILACSQPGIQISFMVLFASFWPISRYANIQLESMLLKNELPLSNSCVFPVSSQDSARLWLGQEKDRNMKEPLTFWEKWVNCVIEEVSVVAKQMEIQRVASQVAKGEKKDYRKPDWKNRRHKNINVLVIEKLLRDWRIKNK